VRRDRGRLRLGNADTCCGTLSPPRLCSGRSPELADQPKTWTTFNAKALLGAALLGQNKYAEAEPLLLGGYQGMKQLEAAIPPKVRFRLTETLQRLVWHYQATQRAEQAARWRQELEALRAGSKHPAT
jgi:hypothetical protein